MDARIIAKPVSSTSDSVDLIVVTRDVFSLGGTVSPQSATTYKFSVQDVNLGGYGQRAQFGLLYDIDRSPHLGYDWLYQK